MANTKCNLFFYYHKCKEFSPYYIHDTKLCAKHKYVCFFLLFTLKLFTLDASVVRITSEFHLFCRVHVCKVNECCLKNCFHCECKIFCLWQAFNGPLVHFFLWFKIFMLIWTLQLALLAWFDFVFHCWKSSLENQKWFCNLFHFVFSWMPS